MILTTSDVARDFGVDDETVRRWCKRGRLRATWLVGQWAILPEDLEAFKVGYRPHEKKRPSSVEVMTQRRAGLAMAINMARGNDA